MIQKKIFHTIAGTTEVLFWQTVYGWMISAITCGKVVDTLVPTWDEATVVIDSYEYL